MSKAIITVATALMLPCLFAGNEETGLVGYWKAFYVWRGSTYKSDTTLIAHIDENDTCTLKLAKKHIEYETGKVLGRWSEVNTFQIVQQLDGGFILGRTKWGQRGRPLGNIYLYPLTSGNARMYYDGYALGDEIVYWHKTWSPPDETPDDYSVMLCSNYGSGDEESIELSFEKNKKQRLIKNTFHKTGYLFKGWAKTKLNADKGIVEYRDGVEIIVNNDMTLYAVWAELIETLTNVRAQQRKSSSLVDIYYDLNAIEGRTYAVDVKIEDVASDLAATTFSGDIGNAIAPGKNHHIIWNAGVDWRGRKGDLRVVAMTPRATGSSGWFFVDTTDGTLKISDVRCKYFDGEYGGVGRKATFLNGVSCDIEMTILDDPVNVDHWLVNGQVVTTRRFTFDVGTLPVGGRLEVVAVGKNDGVRSKPFRANFDIAEHVDEEHAGLWVARPSNSEGIDEIRYTPIGSGSFTFPLAPEKSGAKPSKLNWLPGDEWSICPKIELKLEVRSSGNGSCTFGTAGFEVGTSGSEGTASHKRNRRAVGKFARVMDKDVGITFTGGPLTMSWNAQKKKWVAEDVSFGGEVSGSLGVTHHYPTPIGPVFYEIKGEAALAGIFRVSGLDSALGGLGWGGLETSFSISSDRLPKVSVGGGYGINHIACLKGTVSGMSVLDATYSNGEWHDFRWGLRGSGAVTATFLIFDGKLFELTSDTWWIINNTSPKSMRLMSSAPSSDIEWELQSRDYLKKGTPRMRLMAVAQADGVVESGGYPNPAPAMASGTVGDALAYLRDNAERTSANRTELVLRTGTSNEWNAAETVWDDGTADFMPEIAAMPDGSFVATWVNTGRTFSDDVTLPEMCGAMEIAVGVRDTATGAWSCRNLTADSVLDFAPVVRAGTNGTALVAWLRNAAGSLVGSAAEPTDIMVSVYANGTWSAPAAVVSGAGSVSGFDVAFDGENVLLAFSKDADGNQETMGDMEIFAVRFNGAAWDEPARLTYAGDSDGQPFVRGGAGTGFAVLWTEKGVLMETTELAVSNAVAVAAADGWMHSGGCSVIRGADGRDALVWGGDSVVGGAAIAPVAMMYDPVCGAWGAPRKLLDDGRYERQLAGAVGADGGIRIGYESSSVSTNAEGEVIFGDVELRTRYIPAICDLAVMEDGFSFASEDLADGDETVLAVKVVNLGFKTATNATVTVYEGAGDEKGELASVVTNFPGGGVVAVNVPWTVDNTHSNLQFTVEIDAGGNEDDGADGNNVYIWNAGAYDVSFAGVAVRNESATRRLVTAAVSNVGLGPLPNGGKVVFRRGGESGEVLAVDEIGTVWPGTNGVYNAGFVWDMEGVSFTSAWETVCVQLFPDGVVGPALEAADMAFVQVMTPLCVSDGVLVGVNLDSATEVTVPADVTSIGDYAFSGSDVLRGIVFMGDAPTTGANAFYGVSSECVVYVSRGSTGWGVEIPGVWNGLRIEYLSVSDTVVDVGGGKELFVSGSWMSEYYALVAAAGGDAAKALAGKAANGRKVWECYALGLDPENAEDDFKIVYFPLKSDGSPDLAAITFAPAQSKWNVSDARPVLKGAASLGGDWQPVTQENKAAMRFFKVAVELP